MRGLQQRLADAQRAAGATLFVLLCHTTLMMVILEAATAVAPEADSLDVDDNASQLQVMVPIAVACGTCNFHTQATKDALEASEARANAASDQVCAYLLFFELAS